MWEYTTLVIKDPTDETAMMNRMGQMSWEAYAVMWLDEGRVKAIYFKRPGNQLEWV